MVINTKETTIIEFYIRIIDPSAHWILLSDDKDNHMRLSAAHTPLACLKAKLSAASCYVITYSGLELCLCYYYEPDSVLIEGVTFVENNIDYKKENMNGVHQGLHQETYHFTPFKNWMNDPNGLCWYHGHYHLFYQFHPYAPEPGCMYWGHAISQDLLRWIHLPIAFSPQEEIMKDSNLRGGAWSGSALPFQDHVRLFFTRHIGPNSDRSIKHEYQVSVTSKDLLTFSEESTLLEGPPGKEIASDIRDPKVFRYQNSWYMVLGSACNQIPAVLLYSSEDLDHWSYQGVLYQEASKDTVAFECPDFFEIDGTYILTVSKMRHTDEMGRKDTTHYYAGTFDGKCFHPHSEGLLDFGGNIYAVQTFLHENRRIALGWISDFYKEHISENNSVYGSLSLPRELRLSTNHKVLLNLPVREVYDLQKETLYEGPLQMTAFKLPTAAFYACLEFPSPCKFKIKLNERADGASFQLIGTGDTVELKTIGVPSEHTRFLSPSIPINKLEIFMDHRTCEIFINNGEAAGTKTFYGDNNGYMFTCEAINAKKIPHLIIKQMQ